MANRLFILGSEKPEKHLALQTTLQTFDIEEPKILAMSSNLTFKAFTSEDTAKKDLENMAKDISINISPGHLESYNEIYVTVMQKVPLFTQGVFDCFCVVLQIKDKQKKIVFGKSGEIPLPKEALKIFKEHSFAYLHGNRNHYEIWYQLFPQKSENLKNGTISLYECLTGQKELLWLKNSPFHALAPFLGPAAHLY